ADRARARGARADRARLLEQADRARARHRREDREDARQQRAREARRGGPDAGSALRIAPPSKVLGPIPDTNRDPAAPTVAGCLLQSSPELHEASASPSRRRSSSAAGSSSPTPAGTT